MFGLGLVEIVIIAVVLCLFVKPEDWPKLFRKIGKVYKQIKDFNTGVKKILREVESTVKEPFQDLENDMDDKANKNDTEDKMNQ